MKQIFTLLLTVCAFSYCLAQPANDDCGGIIDLGTAPVCPSPTTYTNVDATASDIGNDNIPPCFVGSPSRDVWLSFVASAAISNYEISVIGVGGAPIINPQLALYRGDCAFDELALLDCVSAGNGETSATLNISGLTAGITYYMRINDWSSNANPNWGEFELCVQELVQTEFTVDQTGSNLCEGTLYDTGGPNGNYGASENHIFTICPDTPSECLLFNLSQYNMEIGNDNLTFYDGPDINSPVITSIIDGASSANLNNVGGVCYQLAAESGCLTIQFISSSFNQMEGFIGTWECAAECPTTGSLIIETEPDETEIADALQNPYFDVTVTDINCDDDSYGIFQQGDETGLGLDDGLLLTTGSAADVSNPASFDADTDLSDLGDQDLDFLYFFFGTGFFFGTSDACVVEMDVTAKTNLVGFDYVFGSDEYKMNFTNNSDDLIGIFISGPGIVPTPGLFGGIRNLAWVPGTNDQELIQIQRINASTNWEFFRNNLDNPSIAYNGLTSGFLGETKTLYAGTEVNPCETYRIKLAIGDTDANDDSGMFIQASDVGFPSIAVDFNSGIDYLAEACTFLDDQVVVTLPSPLAEDFTANVNIGGTATLGDDYILNIPAPITIPAGETSLSFPLTVQNDGVPEGTETIELSLTGDYGCGTVVFSEIEIEIKDQLEVNILPDQDTVFVCDGIFTVNLEVTGASSYSWSPPNVFNDPNSSNPTAMIATDQLVTVTGTTGNCTETDEVFLQIVSPSIDIQPDGPLQICEGETVPLNAINNVSDVGLTWSPTLGLSDPQNSMTDAAPNFTTTYTATVSTTGGCTASDEITINVEPFDFPSWVADNATICQNTSVQLAEEITFSTTNFEWTPIQYLDNANISHAIATPDETTTYNLIATSENGLCTESASVTLMVLPADVDIAPDTIDLCIGDSAMIEAITSTDGIGVTWSPTDSLNLIDAEHGVVKPSISTWYYVTLEVGVCTVADSVFVRVDSIPSMIGIEAIPVRSNYCEGEIISFISPNYEQANFPDIKFQWSPGIGAVSDDTLYNFAANAVETTTYYREITNNACSAIDSIEIIVIPVANIEVTPENPTLCPGETVQLIATADQPIDEWEWSPTNGLSCPDCPDPVASPPGTITYQVQGEFMGCPSSTQVTVEVLGAPNYAFPANPFVCMGDAIVLNTISDPNATYSWRDADGMEFSNDPQPTVSPSATTTYTLEIANGSCPPITDQITISVQEDFTLTVGDDMTICENENVLLTAEATSPSALFIWTDENGDVVSPNIFAGMLQPGSSNIYTVTAFALGSSGTDTCFVYTDEIQIDVYEDFTLTVSPDQTINSGESATLEASADLDGVTFIWSDEEGIIGMESSLTVSPCNTTLYMVEAIHPNECKVDTGWVTVNVLSSFSIDSLKAIDLDTVGKFYEGELINASVILTPANAIGITFEWYLDTQLIATTQDTFSGNFNLPELPEGIDSDSIQIMVIAINSDGCEEPDTIKIEVLRNPVVIPNVFTPNGDGTNDEFTTVSIVPVDVVAISIWNRWGRKVYDNEDGMGSWDGNQDDKAAASDVYIYQIQYSIAGGSTIYTERGDVTLLR